MSKKFAEKTGWTFGLELELNCQIKAESSYDFLWIKRKKDKETIIRAMGDMTVGNGRTVEIVTEPVYVNVDEEHERNKQMIIWLIDLFEEMRLNNKKQIDKTEMEKRFKERFSEDYYIELLGTPELIFGYSKVEIKTKQISFGIPMKPDEIDTFLREMQAPWYDGTRRYEVCDMTEEQKWQCNYILCITDYFIKNWNLSEKGKKEVCSPEIKNKWKIMPRNSVENLFDEKWCMILPLKKVQEIFKSEYKEEDVKECYEILFNTKNPFGGHEKNIRKMKESQLVYECREIDNDLLKDYFWM